MSARNSEHQFNTMNISTEKERKKKERKGGRKEVD